MGIIKAKDVTFEYIKRDEEGNIEGKTTAVDKVSLDIKQGDFIAILGHNGSGKSTIAKIIMGIEKLTSGELILGETLKIGYMFFTSLYFTGLIIIAGIDKENRNIPNSLINYLFIINVLYMNSTSWFLNFI